MTNCAHTHFHPSLQEGKEELYVQNDWEFFLNGSLPHHRPVVRQGEGQHPDAFGDFFSSKIQRLRDKLDATSGQPDFSVFCAFLMLHLDSLTSWSSVVPFLMLHLDSLTSWSSVVPYLMPCLDSLTSWSSVVPYLMLRLDSLTSRSSVVPYLMLHLDSLTSQSSVVLYLMLRLDSLTSQSSVVPVLKPSPLWQSSKWKHHP